MAKDKLRDIILPEVFTVLKFLSVGLAATTVHLSVALLLVAYYNIYPILANFIAFFCAFIVSFLGHFHWTFNSTIEQHVALIKFFTVTSSAFGINNLLLVVLLSQTSLPKELAVVIAAMVIPLVTFISSRLWVFNERRD